MSISKITRTSSHCRITECWTEEYSLQNSDIVWRDSCAGYRGTVLKGTSGSDGPRLTDMSKSVGRNMSRRAKYFTPHANHNLREIAVFRVIQGHAFGITEKSTRGSITCIITLALSLKFSKKQQSKKGKLPSSTIDAPSPRYIRGYLKFLDTDIIALHFCWISTTGTI